MKLSALFSFQRTIHEAGSLQLQERVFEKPRAEQCSFCHKQSTLPLAGRPAVAAVVVRFYKRHYNGLRVCDNDEVVVRPCLARLPPVPPTPPHCYLDCHTPCVQHSCWPCMQRPSMEQCRSRRPPRRSLFSFKLGLCAAATKDRVRALLQQQRRPSSGGKALVSLLILAVLATILTKKR